MGLLRMTYRNIRKSLTLAVGVGLVVVSYVPVLRSRNLRANQIEDVEMIGYERDAERCLVPDDQGEANSRPGYFYSLLESTQSTSKFRILFKLKLPTFRRPRFLLEIGEFNCTMIMICLYILLVDTRIMNPLGITTPELYKSNWITLCNISSGWYMFRSEPPALFNSIQTHLPGFYIIPNIEVISEIEFQYASAMAVTTVTPVTSRIPKDSYRKTSTVNAIVAKRNTDEAVVSFHHAYPIHAGRITKSPYNLRIKSELERCAEKLLTNLRGQAIEITPSFELTLHNCKSAIDFALQNLYPAEKAVSEVPSSQKRSNAIYGVVPGPIYPTTTQGSSNEFPTTSDVEIPSNYLSRYSKRSSCSQMICDWVPPNSLDRCYHRNEAEYLQSGKITYLNDSIDDFKDNAPLECNLCLPEINHEEIGIHCKEVEAAETSIIKGIIIGLGTLLVAIVAGLLIKLSRKRSQRSFSRRAKRGIPMKEARIPVMPLARSSKVIVHGGRVDKRTISNPAPIAHSSKGLEKAFENPRPAPSPPWI